MFAQLSQFHGAASAKTTVGLETTRRRFNGSNCQPAPQAPTGIID
jgi:hypothetical protein